MDPSRQLRAVYRVAAVLLASLWLAACSNPPERYQLARDRAPLNLPDLSATPEPEPRREPLSRSGNRSPYWEKGRLHRVIEVPEGFVQEGTASWYGAKFHGHATASGEIYDLAGLTAAHRNLPLPSYVRVTHRGNGRSLVVKVNDRGPFHSKRIIDLSYAAAARLGMLKAGTAPVRLEVLKTPLTGAALAQSPRWMLQAGAFRSREGAEKLRERLHDLTPGVPVAISSTSVENGRRLYRVRLGPLADAERKALARRLSKAGVPVLAVDLPPPIR